LKSSEERVVSCLARILAREPEIRAWAYMDPQHALAQARALDRMPLRGPLHGIPIGIKDVLDTHDMPTRYGSSIYRDHRPTRDSNCVARLRQAGAGNPGSGAWGGAKARRHRGRAAAAFRRSARVFPHHRAARKRARLCA
jgi:Asp-tRNA(Asn)/Glu-tRNA(Gln) amidotransferase A subunit family amidase